VLLPVVLGITGILFKCLERATKEMDNPQCQKKETIQQGTFSQHTQSAEPCVPTAIPGKTKATIRIKGKDKREIASLPTATCP
jgi:hypothetical protein